MALLAALKALYHSKGECFQKSVFPKSNVSNRELFPQTAKLSLEFLRTGSTEIALEEIDSFPVGGFCRGHGKQDLASPLNPAFA
jgi:hypothetical protein